MSPKTAVIFDLDGTLLDSLGDIAEAMNVVLDRHGLPTHPVDRYRFFVGDGIDHLVRRALPAGVDGAALERIAADMRAEYARRATRTTRPYPGIPELLDALVARGIPMGILTNKPHEPAVAMVRELLGRWPFPVIQGATDGLPKKPDPAGALRVAGALGVPPGRCLYVGDTGTDMRTARAAGMVPVGVLWGFRPREELEAAGARHLIDRPGELLRLVDRGAAGEPG